MKKTFIIFTLFVFSSLLAGCGNTIQSNGNGSQASASSDLAEVKADRIEVVDFHGTRRCPSCQMVEQYARETIEEFFIEEMAAGKITFLSVNGELSENRETVIQYQARGSSLFINAITDGQDNITEDTTVWRLVGDEQKFKTYFKDKLDNLLN